MMMMSWFTKKKSDGKTTASVAKEAADPKATIVKLRETIADQGKREDHIQKRVDSMVKEAKEKKAKGDQKGALFALKRKKLYEAEMEKISNVIMTLETQVINLESASQNATTFEALSAGSKTMKQIRKDVGVEKVDDAMDQIREEMELADEINKAFSSPVDPALMMDDDDLLNELLELEKQDVENELLGPATAGPAANTNTTSGLSLPSVPATKLPAVAKGEEDDLKRLEAELACL